MNLPQTPASNIASSFLRAVSPQAEACLWLVVQEMASVQDPTYSSSQRLCKCEPMCCLTSPRSCGNPGLAVSHTTPLFFSFFLFFCSSEFAAGSGGEEEILAAGVSDAKLTGRRR